MLFSRLRPWRRVPARKYAGPLRMSFVITSMPVGGAETLLVNMLRQMDPARVVPEVVCLKEPGPLGEQIADEFVVHSELLTGKYDLRILPRLVRLFHRRRTDVVVTVGAGDNMFWGRLAAHLAGVPVIASALHSTGWPDGVGRMNRLLTGMTDTFIAVADSHGEFLKDFEKFPANKVQVIRNGVDCKRFSPCISARTKIRSELGVSSDTPLVGIVAALRNEKNHSMLVRAAAEMRDRHPDTHWVIIGDGPERSSIEDLAGELAMADRIHLLGTRHDTEKLVAALDVFTLCSLNEASPVSILEALACQVPVVATDVGSIGESIVDGETGFLIPSEDVQELSDRVSSLLSNPKQRTAMGVAGRQLVLKTGSLDSMVDGYQRMATQLYDNRVRSHRRQTAGNHSLASAANGASIKATDPR
jgi:glycosyltransferase involved in cell wall biosynthesis